MFRDPDIGKPAKQLIKERKERLNAAYELKVPDRVPVSCNIGFLAAKNAGILCSAAYYDYDAWYAANEKALKEFRPDVFGATYFSSGKALEILQPKTMRWPGGGADPKHGFQSIEVDGLKADEFDLYMRDPVDFFIRYQIPRVSNTMDGLASLPPLYKILSGPRPEQALANALAKPDVTKALNTLLKAGREMQKLNARQAKFRKLMGKYGYASSMPNWALPPYDIVSHSLRGMTGTMYDMFRQPDKLLELCDFILKKTLEYIDLRPDAEGRASVVMTNTRGSDEFMSKKQFDTFYWPTFKKLVTELCARGGTPHIFFEGHFDTRLEYLLEFPKGKFVARFDATDIFKAKQVLGNHCCIEGNVPSSLLQVGTKEEVIAYCKKLIDVVGKDGGYVLSPRSSIDEVNPVNLIAMIEFTKHYGVYKRN
jgi:hypothetical protein